MTMNHMDEAELSRRAAALSAAMEQHLTAFKRELTTDEQYVTMQKLAHHTHLNMARVSAGVHHMIEDGIPAETAMAHAFIVMMEHVGSAIFTLMKMAETLFDDSVMTTERAVKITDLINGMIRTMEQHGKAAQG